MARIFLSHSSANNAQALALALWLENQGWSDYFLDVDESRGILAGVRWMAALAAAVDRCEAVVFLVSPAWRDSKYCFAEFFEAKKLGKRIFGVIVEPIALAELPDQMTAEWQVCDLVRGEETESFQVERPPLVPPTVVRFPRAGLESLARGLRKAGLDASTFLWPPPDDPRRSPYPGLRALENADAGVFYGREAEIVRAIDRIRLVRERGLEHLLVILGASGAGKSSFLRAGLLPRLRRDPEHLVVLPPIRPERAALWGSEGLLISLQRSLEATGQSMSPAQLRQELLVSGLASLLRRIERAGRPQASWPSEEEHGAPRTVVLPVDQAEELFAAEGQEEAAQFLELLEKLRQAMTPASDTASSTTGNDPLRLLVVMAIRSDSLARLQAHPTLKALAPELFSLPAMAPAQFGAVIEGPARRHSEAVKPLVIDPRLRDALIHDAWGADALPLLALTLEWLYREFTTAEGTRIGLEEYERLGGVRGVIQQVVYRALDRPLSEPVLPFDPAEQERVLQALFPQIATVDPDTGQWKRRVALRQALGQADPHADAMVSRLIEARLLRSDTRQSDTEEPQEMVEVAHEAMLRQWDLLERWLGSFAADLAACESIRRAAEDWRRGQCDEAYLVHTAHRLEGAEALLADGRLSARFQPIDRDYLAACRQREQSQRVEREERLRQIERQQVEIKKEQSARAQFQKRAWVGLGLASLLVLALGGGVLRQTRAVSRQNSLVLASGSERAANQKRFPSAFRLALLATRGSWVHPAHPTARPALARAANGNRLRAQLEHRYVVNHAGFSPDSNRIVTTSNDGIPRVWDAITGNLIVETEINEDRAKPIVFSPDGKFFVTVSDNKPATLWDASAGKPLWKTMAHKGHVNSVVFSPNGKHILTASDDNTAQLWDAATGKPLGETMTHKAGVNTAVFSPDGKHILTASDDNTARLWHAATGKPQGDSLLHKDSVYSAVFSPDGKHILTVSDNNTAKLWNATSGKPLGNAMTHEISEFSAAFSPNGTHFLTAASDNTARLWDAATGKPIGDTEIHLGGVSTAVFSPDGKRFLTTSRHGSKVRLWDVTNGVPLGEAITHKGRVTSATFSPDGKYILTASEDGKTQLWNATTGKPLDDSFTHQEAVESAVFSPCGKLVLTTSFRAARLWEVTNGIPLGQAMAHQSSIKLAAFSPDGKRILTASRNNTAYLWDANSGKPLGHAMTHIPSPLFQDDFFALFSPSGHRILTAANHMLNKTGTVRLWNATNGKPFGDVISHGDVVQDFIFSPDGNRILTTSRTRGLLFGGNSIRLWDANTGQPVGSGISLNGFSIEVMFSPNGKQVLTIDNGLFDSSEGVVRVWDVTSGKSLGGPMTHTKFVNSALFSPNGKLILTASNDNTARMWDASSGQQLGDAMTHKRPVSFAVFSPDGKRILTVSEDSTARLWDSTTRKLLREAMTNKDSLNHAFFDITGKRIITCSGNNVGQVWDVSTGNALGKTMTHECDFRPIMLSPDRSRFLAVTGGTARLWDATTSKPLGEAMAHEDSVFPIIFSPDGKHILTASDDTTAHIWRDNWGWISDPQALIAKACGQMNREARRITEEDVQQVPLLADRLGEDVCAGVVSTKMSELHR